MKKIILILNLFAISLMYSQSANLDREYFKGSYIEIPSNPILNKDKRTYNVNSNAIKIKGFQRMDQDATIQIDFRFNGTRLGNTEIKTQKHVKKDKEGKIISTTYTYNIHTDYNSSGNVDIYNALTDKNKSIPFSNSSKYVSKNFNRYADAQNYYNNNKYTILNNYKVTHRKQMIEHINYFLNSKYGYPVHNQRDNFWILGKKKHPEYANHIKAYEQAKNILAKMKYNEPIDAIKLQMKPVITYFEKVVPKYQGNKKKMRKMRYASFYNLAKIYYYLDNPDKTIEYAQKLIDNDYDKKDGKHFITLAKALKQRLKANKVNTRHFDITPPSIEKITLEYEDVESYGDTADIIAYVITEDNDTIQATMPFNNIKKIGYDVSLVLKDGNGKVGDINYLAEESKELALTNGDVYKVIYFNEITKSDRSSRLKFVKSIFESDKIGIYLFKDKEIVIKFPDSEKGISTLSPEFAFGVNKKLAEYAKDCPELLKETKAKHFKNTVDSLTEFAKKYTTCKTK